MMNAFANRLKTAMSRNNTNLTNLSKISGISKPLISNYLSGNYEAKQQNIYKLAVALNVNPAWLMGMDVPMHDSNDFAFGLELEKIFSDISKELNIPIDELKTVFLGNGGNYMKNSIELNFDNLHTFFINYFKNQKYKKILKEKGLMDENENINEESLNKLLKIADMIDVINKKEN